VGTDAEKKHKHSRRNEGRGGKEKTSGKEGREGKKKRGEKEGKIR